jgi:hypothetical protein
LNSFKVKSLFLVLVLGIQSLFIAYSQPTSGIRALIFDSKSNTPLPGATCLILKRQDSSTVMARQANAEGRFFARDLEKGDYLLKVQFLGYKPEFRPFAYQDSPIDLGTISLDESALDLKAVKIEGQALAVRQLGDTTQFNANSFKTNTDATAEDLLTKMPGVTVQDGKVNVQGEEVRKVLIDNKPFFGDDPNTAIKNLPADVIDKIQVFDQLSDQSRFTGFNDGNTTGATFARRDQAGAYTGGECQFCHLFSKRCGGKNFLS